VILEKDAGDSTVAGYTHEGGSLYHDLISMDRTNSYYYLFDGLGSVKEMVDSSENTQNSYSYEAFGQIKSSTENVTNYYKYVGAYGVHHDSTPGLYFMQAGAPEDPPSLHRYLYVRNQPANYMDPYGLRKYSSYQECVEDAAKWRDKWLRWKSALKDVCFVGCALLCAEYSGTQVRWCIGICCGLCIAA